MPRPPLGQGKKGILLRQGKLKTRSPAAPPVGAVSMQHTKGAPHPSSEKPNGQPPPNSTAPSYEVDDDYFINVLGLTSWLTLSATEQLVVRRRLEGWTNAEICRNPLIKISKLGVQKILSKPEVAKVVEAHMRFCYKESLLNFGYAAEDVSARLIGMARGTLPANRDEIAACQVFFSALKSVTSIGAKNPVDVLADPEEEASDEVDFVVHGHEAIAIAQEFPDGAVDPEQDPEGENHFH